MDREQAFRDSELIRELSERMRNGERVLPDKALEEVLQRMAPDLGYAPEDIARGMSSQSSAERLVLDAQQRISQGSRRLGAVLIAAAKSKEKGEVDEGLRLLRDYVESEAVPYYAEMARRAIRRYSN